VDPGISLTLVEARRKRASFLLTVRRELGLEDVVVREGRAEDLAEEDPGLAEGFDAVVARAVGRAEELLAISQKYLKPGGLFIASGPPHPPSGGLLEPVRVPVPGTRRSRVFLKAVKES
jgi:16S rRNA (guanine527-N7)-methyltransferase